MKAKPKLRRYIPGNSDPSSDYCHTSRSLRAMQLVNDEDARTALRRHLSGSWGELDPAVFDNGEFKGAHGILRLTVHLDRHGTKFGIVTLLKHLETIIFMPDEL